jgi:hypothetical protein
MKRLLLITFMLFTPTLLTGCRQDKPVAKASLSAVAPAVVVQFADITSNAGIRFKHNNGAFGAKWLPETMGSGVAFIDYNGDGYADIFLVNGRDWTDAEVHAFVRGSGKNLTHLVPQKRTTKRCSCALYRNNRNGTFSDVTKQAGLDVEMYGMGASVGDYDNDGWEDLYVTALGRNYLFRNVRDGKFQDVAEEAGVKDAGWSTSAAWVDYDKDGWLDLFVCHYVEWTPATDIYCTLDGQTKSYCTPESYVGQVSRLYHNERNGHFKDVSEKAGIHRQVATAGRGAKILQGKSLGVAICDYNNDGWPDIVVANDTEPNYLFHNNRDGTFTEVGVEVSIAYNEAGMPRAAMGVDAADIDHSGYESLIFGNFSNQMLGLYHNRQGRLFIDIAPTSEVGRVSQQFLAFGTIFVDIDNDTWPDIFVANGHVENEINKIQRDVYYAERPLLFRNIGGGKFVEIGLQSGEAMARPVVGRGCAYADIDLDGDADLILTINGGPAILFRNDGGNKNNSVRLILQGTKSNRSGIGAIVETKVGSEILRSMVRSGSSYCSQSELPLTIGLGRQLHAAFTIRWPSGKVTELKNLPANQIVTVNEEKGIVKQQPFHKLLLRQELSSPSSN